MTAKKEAAKTLRITQVKSAIGKAQDQKDTIRALGLKRMNHTIDKADSPAVRGMIFKVKHLLKVEEL